MKLRKIKIEPISGPAFLKLAWICGTFFLCALLCWLTFFPAYASPKQDDKVEKISLQEEIARGKTIFEKNGCSNCHLVNDVGGCLAPPLNGISDTRNKRFIVARLSDAPKDKEVFYKDYAFAELFEHIRVSHSDANYLAAYLLSLKEHPSPKLVIPHGSDVLVVDSATPAGIPKSDLLSSNARAGKELFFDKGCSACHSIGNLGGHIGPSLDSIALVHSRQWILNKIESAGKVSESGDKKQAMPQIKATKEEMGQIVDFLLSIPAKEDK